MGIGVNYKCECGYSAMVVRGPMMFTGETQFEGGTCDTCHELVSAPVDYRSLRRYRRKYEGQVDERELDPAERISVMTHRILHRSGG